MRPLHVHRLAIFGDIAGRPPRSLRDLCVPHHAPSKGEQICAAASHIYGLGVAEIAPFVDEGVSQ